LWRADTDKIVNRRATLIRHALSLTITKRLLTITMIEFSFET
jgi:hypothetical protein